MSSYGHWYFIVSLPVLYFIVYLRTLRMLQNLFIMHSRRILIHARKELTFLAFSVFYVDWEYKA